MKGKYTHPTEEVLLSFIDGELPPHLMGGIHKHLEECWDCRLRRKELEQTIEDFVQVHHESLDGLVPAADGPRALLRARMMEAERGPQLSWFHWLLRLFESGRARYALVGLAALAIVLAASYRVLSMGKADRQASSGVAYVVPDSQLTPGSVRPVTVNEVCATTYDDDTDQVPVSLKREVFRKYRIKPQQTGYYVLDYLVSPQLGGTADISNLWPEPEAQTIWNIRAKDALEDHLHELVCQGRVDLATAQRDLTTNWVSAYQKYFHTSQPVSPL